jgi:hypothetical protein
MATRADEPRATTRCHFDEQSDDHAPRSPWFGIVRVARICLRLPWALATTLARPHLSGRFRYTDWIRYRRIRAIVHWLRRAGRLWLYPVVAIAAQVADHHWALAPHPSSPTCLRQCCHWDLSGSYGSCDVSFIFCVTFLRNCFAIWFMTWPNHSPQPTRDGRFNSDFAVDFTGPVWLSSCLRGVSTPHM